MRGKRPFLDWRVAEPELVKCIGQLRQQEQWEVAAVAMREYLEQHTERESTIRLAFAQLLLQQLNQPRQALEILEAVNEAFLDPKQQPTYRKLLAATQKRIGG